MAGTVSDPVQMIFTILCPPLGVFCKVGLTRHFWFNLGLTLLGYIPGVVHAIYVSLDS